MKEEVKKKHSELGIVSFIIAFFELILWIRSFRVNLIQSMTMELFFIVFLGGPFAALVLGIGGLIQKNRKRIFSILGIVLSGLVFFIIGILIYVAISSLL